MRLLVFGRTGQVARELARRTPLGVTLLTLDRADADLSKPETCTSVLRSTAADAVINAAAWTAVDKAETDETQATVVNGVAPTAMAQVAADKGIPILQISTDYVFDGSGDIPFRPDSPTGPLSAYGRSKLAGEVGVQMSGARHAILRTSWVVSAHGTNFVRTMLRLGRERSELNVVADQIGGPTSAAAIADAVFACAQGLIEGASSDIYHFTGAPDTSWADFARAIMADAKLECHVNDIPSSEYPTPAVRPRNSRLDCTSLARDFGVDRPNWRADLADILADLRENR